MKITITFIICVFILASCSKPPKPITDITVFGRIMDSVHKKPFNNTQFLLFQMYYNGSIGRESQVVPFTTDSLGYFSTTFNISKSQDITLTWPEYANGMSSKARITGGAAVDGQLNRLPSYDFGTVYTSRNF